MKKMISVLLISALAFSLCACSSGKSGQPSQSQESSQSTELSAESSAPMENASESEASDAIEEEHIKSGHDDLSEEDIQALKEAIGKAVLAEYCEPNNIDPANFSWDVFTSSYGGGYDVWLEDLQEKIRESDGGPIQANDERIERVTVEDGADDNAKVTAAICNGAIDYLNTKVPYNAGYLASMTRIPDICNLVETIDLPALSE